MGKVSLFITIAVFTVLCFSVLHLLLSLCLWWVGIDTAIFQPVVGVLIPILLLIDMISLLHTCDYEENIAFFNRLVTKDRIKVIIYLSMGLANPMLLYVHTKSFKHPIRIFGILRCFPVLNIFLYSNLIRELRKKDQFENNPAVQYLKGMLILEIIRKEKS